MIKFLENSNLEAIWYFGAVGIIFLLWLFFNIKDFFIDWKEKKEKNKVKNKIQKIKNISKEKNITRLIVFLLIIIIFMITIFL